MADAPSFVVITRAPVGDYQQNYVALPADYGSPAYFSRPDVRAIRQAVFDNLSALDAQTGFTRQLAGRKVVIKPNLVTVYHHMGLSRPDYPETTDPRVLDAVVAFLKEHTQTIVIAEGSGRGVPTRGEFKVAGLDRLARRHRIQLIPLDEQPVDRYHLPKAKIQREVLIPRIFSEVAHGEAFYLSLPKMKTNLYTGVTLGFKNAMGILPYNLRQRCHHFALEQKLVDLLFLIRPDLVVIDGIVGAEGNCPAPVTPVDSRVIVSGNHPVETDRVATRLMGFDPAEIGLLRIADEMGFGGPQPTVIGDETPIPFRPADPSLFSAEFHAQFPNVRALVGHSAPTGATPAGMGMHCRGGCLAVARFGFDMLVHENQPCDLALTVIIGEGARRGGETVYFDRDGKTYTLPDIRALPGKKLAMGHCTQALAGIADRFVDGCMPFPNSAHTAVHFLGGTFCRVLTPRNRYLLPLLWDTLQASAARRRLIRRGQPVDCDIPLESDPLMQDTPPAASSDADFIPWPFPPLTPIEVRRALHTENRAVLATFFG